MVVFRKIEDHHQLPVADFSLPDVQMVINIGQKESPMLNHGDQRIDGMPMD